MSGNLTAKQQRFVDEYLIDLNGTKAAIRAGYNERSAAETASKHMAKPAIAKAIQEAIDDRSERTRINADWLLKRLADEAEADVGDLYGEDGQLLPIKEWPLIWRQGLVAGIDIEEIKAEGVTMGMVKKIRVSDRVKRLELIGKHIRVNAFQEVVQHKGLEGLAERLDRAAGRLDDDA